TLRRNATNIPILKRQWAVAEQHGVDTAVAVGNIYVASSEYPYWEFFKYVGDIYRDSVRTNTRPCINLFVYSYCLTQADPRKDGAAVKKLANDAEWFVREFI